MGVLFVLPASTVRSSTLPDSSVASSPAPSQRDSSPRDASEDATDRQIQCPTNKPSKTSGIAFPRSGRSSKRHWHSVARTITSKASQPASNQGKPKPRPVPKATFTAPQDFGTTCFETDARSILTRVGCHRYVATIEKLGKPGRHG